MDPIANAFDALANIADAALVPVKVALFDAAGNYAGFTENRADLLGQQSDDEYTRVPWREEWDALIPVPLGALFPFNTIRRLPIPNLAELQNE